MSLKPLVVHTPLQFRNDDLFDARGHILAEFCCETWKQEQIVNLVNDGATLLAKLDETHCLKSEAEFQVAAVKKEAAKVARKAKKERAVLVNFAKHINRNYDCDSDAHKYGTPCRCCKAAEVLAEVGETAEGPYLKVKR
jgi:hypothetical protein